MRRTLSAAWSLNLIVVTSLAAQAPKTVWLSELDLGKARQGWGQPKEDQSVTGAVLSIAGRKFERGFGTHASGSLWVDLAEGSERFRALVGVDDDVGKRAGSVSFKIVADGRTVWRSAVMKTGEVAPGTSLFGIQK